MAEVKVDKKAFISGETPLERYNSFRQMITDWEKDSESIKRELELVILSIFVGILGNVFADSIFGIATASEKQSYYWGMLGISGVGLTFVSISLYYIINKEKESIKNINAILKTFTYQEFLHGWNNFQIKKKGKKAVQKTDRRRN